MAQPVGLCLPCLASTCGWRSALRALVGVACLILLFAAAGAARGQTLNMSRDLVSLGIAARNMTPDDQALDARPLFQAAVDYTRTHGIRTLTADRGTYYFRTPQYAFTFLVIGDLVDVTIDLQGSTILFDNPRPNGIQLFYCQRVVLTNVVLDYVNTPYTHTTITAVDGANRQLHYAVQPGWFDPTAFSGDATANETSVVVALAFRDGDIVPGTTRMPVRAVASGTVSLFQNNAPWTQAPTLGTLRVGDTLVVTYRGGGPPLTSWFSDAITISQVRIHGSGAWAIEMEQNSNSIVEHVRIEPRPGLLLGSTSDGIHFRHDLRNNHIRHCYVTRTVDDALILESLAAGKLVAQSGPRTLSVTRDIYTRFANGTRIAFVDPANASEIAGGVIVSQSPPDGRQLEFNGLVVLTLDRDLPALPANATMVFADPEMRGSGSTIEDNVVERIPFGRGIWISGTIGSTVQRNIVRSTSSGGITVSQATSADPGPPVRDLTVQSNVLDGNLGPAASGTGTQTSMAALIVSSTSTQARFAPSSVNTNVVIQDNYIADSGRGGIWVGASDGVTLQRNLVTRWYQRPQLPIWGIAPDLRDQVLDDLKQAVALRDSVNVTTANDLRAFSTITAPVTLSTPAVVVPAAGGTASVGVKPAVGNMEWGAWTDDSFITVGAPSLQRGGGAVVINVGANTGATQRTGQVFVAGVPISVQQAPATTSATPGWIALATPSVVGDNVTLNWSEPVGGGMPNRSTVLASLTSGGPVIARLEAGTARSLTVKAPPGTYYVRVQAANASGNSPLSNEAIVVVGDGGIPGAPQGLTAFVRGSAVTLAWGAPANLPTAVVTAFQLEVGSAAGLSDIAKLNLGTAMQFEAAAVPSGRYYIRVRSTNSAGTGPASDEVQVAVAPAATQAVRINPVVAPPPRLR